MLLAVCFLACRADAATIRVAQDGTGDFLVLQDGLDAAAEGDTILVGPGRYDEFQQHMQGGVYPVVAIGWVRTPNVTILGESKAGTIVGPADPLDQSNGLATGCIGMDDTALNLTVENLTVENAGYLIWVNGQVSVRRCLLQGSLWSSVQAYEDHDIVVEDCEIRDTRGFVGVYLFGTSDARIERCQFTNIEGNGVGIGGSTGVVIEGCVFQGGSGGGVSAWGGSQVDIANSRFLGPGGVAMHYSGSSGELLNNHVNEGYIHAVFLAGGVLSGLGNVFEGATISTLEISGSAPLRIHLQHGRILNGGGYSAFVAGRFSAGVTATDIDLRHNAWGTNDLEQIGEWIRDGSDPDVIEQFGGDYVSALFDPIIGTPLATEEATMGSIKARFRRGGN